MSKELRVGVLFTGIVQLLDLAAVDLFGMTTPEYLTICGIPEDIVNLARPLKLFYIGCPTATAQQQPASHNNASSVVQVTSTAGVCLTHTIEDSEVSPGNLDVLVIPGPEPTTIPDAKTQDFVRAHNANKTTFLVICTGALVTAHSGIYEGRHVTGPKAFLPVLKKDFPNAEWDDSLRVVQDGHIWTAGGITNGIDLVAAYLRATFPSPVAEIVCSMAEVGDRPLKYATTAN